MLRSRHRHRHNTFSSMFVTAIIFLVLCSIRSVTPETLSADIKHEWNEFDSIFSDNFETSDRSTKRRQKKKIYYVEHEQEGEMLLSSVNDNPSSTMRKLSDNEDQQYYYYKGKKHRQHQNSHSNKKVKKHFFHESEIEVHQSAESVSEPELEPEAAMDVNPYRNNNNGGEDHSHPGFSFVPGSGNNVAPAREEETWSYVYYVYEYVYVYVNNKKQKTNEKKRVKYKKTKNRKYKWKQNKQENYWYWWWDGETYNWNWNESESENGTEEREIFSATPTVSPKEKTTIDSAATPNKPPIPITSMPITSMPISSMPTTAMPTTAMPTTSMPTTSMPTTSMPTSSPTTPAPSAPPSTSAPTDIPRVRCKEFVATYPGIKRRQCKVLHTVKYYPWERPWECDTLLEENPHIEKFHCELLNFYYRRPVNCTSMIEENPEMSRDDCLLSIPLLPNHPIDCSMLLVDNPALTMKDCETLIDLRTPPINCTQIMIDEPGLKLEDCLSQIDYDPENINCTSLLKENVAMTQEECDFLIYFHAPPVNCTQILIEEPEMELIDCLAQIKYDPENIKCNALLLENIAMTQEECEILIEFHKDPLNCTIMMQEDPKMTLMDCFGLIDYDPNNINCTELLKANPAITMDQCLGLVEFHRPPVNCTQELLEDPKLKLEVCLSQIKYDPENINCKLLLEENIAMTQEECDYLIWYHKPPINCTQELLEDPTLLLEQCLAQIPYDPENIDCEILLEQNEAMTLRECEFLIELHKPPINCTQALQDSPDMDLTTCLQAVFQQLSLGALGGEMDCTTLMLVNPALTADQCEIMIQLEIDRTKTNKPTNMPTFVGFSRPDVPELKQRLIFGNFERYPGSRWPVKPTGQIYLFFDDYTPKKLRRYNEQLIAEMRDTVGLENWCKECRVRLHEGPNCQSIEKIGPEVEKPKWSGGNAVYNAKDGVGNAQFILRSGINYGDDVGKVVVLEGSDASGNQGMACAVLRYGDTTHLARLLETTIAPIDIPRFKNEITSGTVDARFEMNNAGKVYISWNVYNMPEGCEEGGKGCMVRIRTGTTCQNNMVGNSYYNSEEDPFTNTEFARYYTDENRHSTGGFLVFPKLSYFDTFGHAITFHHPKGFHVACGVLQKKRDSLQMRSMTAKMSKYKFYEKALEPRGYVHAMQLPNRDVHLRFQMEGLEEECEKCSLLISNNRKCERRNLGTEPLWDKEDSVDEPYSKVFYSVLDGRSMSDVLIRKGAPTFFHTLGYTLIIKDSAGDIISCGILQAAEMQVFEESLVASMELFPQYRESRRPEGNVQMIFEKDNTFHFLMDVSGLDHTCRNCMVRIKNGYTCDDPYLTGDKDFYSLKENPWTAPDSKAVYTSIGGSTRTKFTFNTGMSYLETMGRVVILHGSTGVPMSCGLLKPGYSLDESGWLIGDVSADGFRKDTETNARGKVRILLQDGKAVLHAQVYDSKANVKNGVVVVARGKSCFGGYEAELDGFINRRLRFETDERGDFEIFETSRWNDKPTVNQWNMVGQAVFFLDAEENKEAFACARMLPGDYMGPNTEKYVAQMYTDNGGIESVGTATIFKETTVTHNVYVSIDIAGLGPCMNCFMHIHKDSCENLGGLSMRGFKPYTVDEDGVSTSTFTMTLKGNKESYLNKPFSLKNEKGAKTACGILKLVEQIRPKEFNKRAAEKFGFDQGPLAEVENMLDLAMSEEADYYYSTASEESGSW